MDITDISSNKKFLLFDATQNLLEESDDIEDAVTSLLAIIYLCSPKIDEQELLEMARHAGIDLYDYNDTFTLATWTCRFIGAGIIDVPDLNELLIESALEDGRIWGQDQTEIEKFKQSAHNFETEWNLSE